MNLTDLFNQENKVVELQMDFPFEKYNDEVIKNEAKVSLILTNIGKGKVLMKGLSNLEFTLSCDRCLKDVDSVVSLDFEREVYAPELLEDDDMREDQHFVSDYELDIEALLREELQMEWPSKILCDEDCKGICKKCGCNLNDGKCECDDFVPDIRFANLMDIFNNSQK